MATDTAATVDTEQTDLWVKSYQGEVLGEAYFRRMAELATDPDEKAKLEALTALERCTKELIAPSLERLGISTEPDPGMLAAASAVSDYDYHAMLESVPAVAADYLVSYSRLRELAGPADAHVVDQLIAHELALEVFMRREQAGQKDTSLEPIKALAHVTI